MKKFLLACLLVFSCASSMAVVDTEETQFSVKVTLSNDVSPWFQVNTDNIGLGLSVSAGSCRVEIALESIIKCNAGTAISFDWDIVPSVTSGNKKYISLNGASCARVVCTSGTGIFLIRRH